MHLLANGRSEPAEIVGVNSSAACPSTLHWLPWQGLDGWWFLDDARSIEVNLVRAMLVSLAIGLASAPAGAQPLQVSEPEPFDPILNTDFTDVDIDAETAVVAPPGKAVTGQLVATAGIEGPESGIQWTLGWALRGGLQRNPPQLAAGDYTNADASFQAGLRYKLHEKVFFAASLSATLDLTAMPGDNRRANMGSTFARLNFRNLYTESFTGIALGGNVTYFLPQPDDFLYGNPRTGAFGGALQLFKSVGPVTLVGSVGLNKSLYLRARPYADCDAEAVAAKGASCPVDSSGEPLAVGGWNTSHAVSTSLSAVYGTGPWSFSSALSYTVGNTYSEMDPTQLGSIVANPNSNNRYSTLFFVQAGYTVYKGITVSAAFSNAGPTLTGRESYNNPLFDPRFASVTLGVDVLW